MTGLRTRTSTLRLRPRGLGGRKWIASMSTCGCPRSSHRYRWTNSSRDTGSSNICSAVVQQNGFPDCFRGPISTIFSSIIGGRCIDSAWLVKAATWSRHLTQIWRVYTPDTRQDVTDHLRRGATMSFDAIDELHEPLDPPGRIIRSVLPRRDEDQYLCGMAFPSRSRFAPRQPGDLHFSAGRAKAMVYVRLFDGRCGPK